MTGVTFYHGAIIENLNVDDPDGVLEDNKGTTALSHQGVISFDLTKNGAPIGGAGVVFERVQATRIYLYFTNEEMLVLPLSNKAAGETIFFYTQAEEMVKRVEVESNGNTVVLGGVHIINRIYTLAISTFNISIRGKDYSPYEQTTGGYVDYREGVYLNTVEMEIFDKLENLSSMLSALMAFKKKRMGFDLHDSHIRSGQISKVLQFIGRISDSSITIESLEDQELSEEHIYKGTIAIEEAS